MTATAEPDIGAAPNHWCDVVRRAELPSTVKLVAFTLATYANNRDDAATGRRAGASIYPGVARLAVDTDTSVSTVKRSLRALVDAGLVELVRRGARRRGMSDEYRLVFAVDLMERVKVRSPDEHKAQVTHLKGVTSRRTSRTTSHSPDAVLQLTGEPYNTASGVTGEL